ncbi:glycosyltransferase family 4 protein [Actinomadura vinacea]|uniref:Glycosyltransferase family 4 protein n=1 Tax=Actinomadura vinacea TaxID=115336 RepID=A0ABP5VYM6_9ACTN
MTASRGDGTGTSREVHVVLPGDVDDPSVPSGGNVYDRRVCELLAAGRPVREVAVPGPWPLPHEAGRAALARALAEAPDGAVVLLDGLVACGVPEIVVPAARRLRLAVLVHLPLADDAGPSDLDGREREVLRAAAAVVTTSPWASRRLIQHHGLDPARLHVAEPGTDPAPVAPFGDGTRLLCVASLTPRKGHDLLVEALAALAARPWGCTCAGPLRRDPGHADRINGLVQRHGLTGRVRLAGPLTGAALEAAYDAADLVVLPSRAETYGMVVAESLARGIPVLATSVGGVPGTLGRAPGGEIPGMLVPPGDVPALTAALRRWFDDPDLRLRLRNAALARRGTLPTWDDSVRRLAATLADLHGEEPR